MSLRVESVSVRIDGVDVLHDVDLDVADREVVAVLGPSGSGKTTLLRVIAGLHEPTTGRVLLDGRDVTRVPTHRRGVGLMFQDHALFPHRDVAGNVAFGLRMARTPAAEVAPRVEEALALVGLAGFGRRAVDNLSGGERQRVALARALAPRPSVLLLDEPLGALDRALRDRLLDELGDVLERSGSTVVHVTHDQAEAFATGQRVVVMRDGRIAQVAPPLELWRRPVDAEVARIVGPAALVPVEVDGAAEITAPWGRLVAGVVEVAGSVGAGAAVLVLRPDGVEVVTDPAHAHLTGEVVARSFRGDHVLVRVAVAVRSDGVVEIPVIDRTDVAGPAGSSLALRLVPGAGVVVPPR